MEQLLREMNQQLKQLNKNIVELTCEVKKAGNIQENQLSSISEQVDGILRVAMTEAKDCGKEKNYDK